MFLFAQVEEDFDIPPLDFRQFAAEHWWEYLLILVFLIYVYNNVFRVRKLPLLKDAVIYLLIALGAFLLLTFQIDANLPIWQCLAIAVGLMLFVRIRYWVLERSGKRREDEASRNGQAKKKKDS